MKTAAHLIAVFVATGLLAVMPSAQAQRAVQSPLTVQVIRTKTDKNDQQIGLKITVRNMSSKPVEMKLEALFTGEPMYGGRSREFIFSERKTSKTFAPGESHEFNTESDAGVDRTYSFDGTYYSYSSLKIKGYLTRVFADGQLVNVSGSVPSLQKVGWDDEALDKLGYSGANKSDAPRTVAAVTPPPVVAPEPTIATPRVVMPADEPPAETPRQPRAVMPRDDDDAPANPAVAVTPPSVPAVLAPTPAPVKPAQPVVSTWHEPTYTATAKRYNAAVDAYQSWLAKRGTQATLKDIENELHECASAFEKIQDGAPAAYNVPGLVTKCRQTIFAVHGTLQALP